jgi:hypothetical protein
MTTPNNLFVSRNGTVITDNDLNLTSGHAFNIDNIPILSANELGVTVSKSKLRQVGTLNNLDVAGDAVLGQFAFFNSTFNRVGLGTEEPNFSLSIVDNNVELGFGSPQADLAVIGTVSNSDVGIISDNIVRVTVKTNGEVVIGDTQSKNGVLRVNGTIYADSYVSDTRIDRMSSVQFHSSRDHTIYGLGLQWNATDYNRQLVLRADPDRLWTTEAIDIGADRSYYIDGVSVLSSSSLGRNIVNSNLTTVGTLQTLAVQGEATFIGDVNASQSTVTANSVLFNDGVSSLEIKKTGIDSNKSIAISVQAVETFYADDKEINIGDRTYNTKPIKLFGPLSVGINNPDPEVDLAVNGVVEFEGKKFFKGSQAPTSGMFNQGDICWNTNPFSGSFVGWICVASGTPGVWSTFGLIS